MKSRRIAAGEQGVTLVEVAITLSVIGLVAMLAIPSMIGMMPRIRLSSDAVTLANEIALSRARAISKNQEFRLIFDAGADSYTLRNETANASFATNTVSPDVDLYLVQGLAPADTLAVRPVGSIGRANASGNYENLPLGTVARIHLQTLDGAHRKRIVIEPTGRVHVQRWVTGTSWVED